MTTKRKSRKIFLVDDDEDDQLIFIEALQAVDPDITVETAYHGRKALQMLNSMTELPDLIVLDINMPVMDGFECLKEVRKDSKFQDIPIIIYSTSHALIMVQKAENLKADAFLTKPSSHKQLEIKLGKILSTDFSIPSKRIRIFSHFNFPVW